MDPSERMAIGNESDLRGPSSDHKNWVQVTGVTKGYRELPRNKRKFLSHSYDFFVRGPSLQGMQV